jgi:hypothetical protein
MVIASLMADSLYARIGPLPAASDLCCCGHVCLGVCLPLQTDWLLRARATSHLVLYQVGHLTKIGSQIELLVQGSKERQPSLELFLKLL